MVSKKIIAAAFASSATALLAGCDHVPAQPHVQTLVCYDYLGNPTLQETVKGVNISSGNTLVAESGNGQKTYVSVPQCIHQAAVYDQDSIAHAEAAAPYTVVVTNGVDRILLTGRFNQVGYSSYGVITAKLTDHNNQLLRKVSTIGLPTVATAQQNSLPDMLKVEPSAP